MQTDTPNTDALLGVVAALGAVADTVELKGRTFVAITYDLPMTWTMVDIDHTIAAFRKQLSPALYAAGFGIDGTSRGFDYTRKFYSFRISASSKGPLTAFEEYCVATFSGRD